MSLSIEERYTPVTHINKGAFASVCLARDRLRNNAPVALKRINPSKFHPERAQREASIHMLFSHHPNVATLMDAGAYRDTYAMVVELAETDLLEAIVPDVGLGEEKALSFMAQVMSALEFMHSCGYVHRDIKPENLALMSDGTVRVLDFGHASHVSEVGPSNSRIGTAQYLAPEGVRGAPQDPTKMDVFSAGVCLFAIATGRFPWISANSRDPEYSAWLQGKFGPKNKAYWLGLSPRMQKLLRCMLEADPKKRWSAGQVREFIRLSSGYSAQQVVRAPVSAIERLKQSSRVRASNIGSVGCYELEHTEVAHQNQAPVYCCV